jgi:hypothetical protein
VARRSDLSGDLIEGDSACRLEVRFPDGRRKELVVRLEEAEDIAAKGRDAPSTKRRVGSSASEAARSISKWVLLSLVGVLVVQAVTKQWSDRQKELELKKSLASDIGTSAYQAFAQARSIAFLPESDRTTERKLLVLTAWIRDEGRIDATFRSYLQPPDVHQATTEWISFRSALYKYLLLACCQKADDRKARLREVTDALREQGSAVLPPHEADAWHTLGCGPSCPRYATAYDWLGRQVLRSAPYRAIEASHPKGFSDGFGDFVHDAIPGY